MTWDELSALLSKLAEEHDTKARIIPIEGLEAVFLHLVPVAWFSSMKFAGALNIGVYQGDENRLVGTEQIPLAELTPEFVRERVEKAAVEQFSRCLDPEAVRDFLEQFPRPQLRDIDGGRRERSAKGKSGCSPRSIDETLLITRSRPAECRPGKSLSPRRSPRRLPLPILSGDTPQRPGHVAPSRFPSACAPATLEIRHKWPYRPPATSAGLYSGFQG